MQRANKEARKIVADTIKTRASMKRRRKTLPSKPSREPKNTKEIDIESNEASGNDVYDVESNQDLVRKTTSWPQTIIFPEG